MSGTRTASGHRGVVHGRPGRPRHHDGPRIERVLPRRPDHLFERGEAGPRGRAGGRACRTRGRVGAGGRRDGRWHAEPVRGGSGRLRDRCGGSGRWLGREAGRPDVCRCRRHTGHRRSPLSLDRRPSREPARQCRWQPWNSPSTEWGSESLDRGGARAGPGRPPDRCRRTDPRRGRGRRRGQRSRHPGLSRRRDRDRLRSRGAVALYRGRRGGRRPDLVGARRVARDDLAATGPAGRDQGTHRDRSGSPGARGRARCRDRGRVVAAGHRGRCRRQDADRRRRHARQEHHVGLAGPRPDGRRRRSERLRRGPTTVEDHRWHCRDRAVGSRGPLRRGGGRVRRQFRRVPPGHRHRHVGRVGSPGCVRGWRRRHRRVRGVAQHRRRPMRSSWRTRGTPESPRSSIAWPRRQGRSCATPCPDQRPRTPRPT